jgi:hypothetical protein
MDKPRRATGRDKNPASADDHVHSPASSQCLISELETHILLTDPPCGGLELIGRHTGSHA